VAERAARRRGEARHHGRDWAPILARRFQPVGFRGQRDSINSPRQHQHECIVKGLLGVDETERAIERPPRSLPRRRRRRTCFARDSRSEVAVVAARARRQLGSILCE
jgi:hypothetical protein